MEMMEYPDRSLTCPTKLSLPNSSDINLEDANGEGMVSEQYPSDTKQIVAEVCKTHQKRPSKG